MGVGLSMPPRSLVNDPVSMDHVRMLASSRHRDAAPTRHDSSGGFTVYTALLLTVRPTARVAGPIRKVHSSDRSGEIKSLGKVVAPSLIVLTPRQSLAGHVSPFDRTDICLAQCEGAVVLAQEKVRISGF